MSNDRPLSRRSLLAATGAGLLAVAGGAGCGPSASGGGLFGIADLHFHLANHLGYGGSLFTGLPHHPDGIAGALADCSGPHGIGGTGLNGSNLPILSFVEKTGYDAGIGHMTNGFPHFNGWPRFTSTIHQQGYVDWIRRAHKAGLRLMVALTGNNRMLADMYGGPRPSDDVSAVRDQVAYTKQFAADNADFTEVALSPADARRIVGAGKLAIVIGVEVDQLGGFGPDEGSIERVDRYLDHLHEIGVRYVFPIHLVNNAFGGAALYHDDLFWALQIYLNREPFRIADDPPPDVEFRFGDFLPALTAFLFNGGRLGAEGWHPNVIGHAHTNALGLTTLGEATIRALIRKRFLIDVDHMSQKALDRTLTIAEEAKYPLFSGHTGFRPLAWRKDTETAHMGKVASETLKTDVHIERIRRLGGMIAPQLHQGDIRPAHGVEGSGVRNRNIVDCAGSSTSYAHAYLYAVAKMGGQSVGLGSDCNGFAQLPGPRFGPNAAYHLHSDQANDETRKRLRRDQVTVQANGVNYNRPGGPGEHRDWRRYRWAEGITANDLMKDEEKDMWQAIGVDRAGCDVWANKDPAGNDGIENISERVKNLAKGLQARSDEELERPGPFSGDAPWEQRTSWLLKNGMRPGGSDRDHPRVHELFTLLEPVWQQAQRMDGKNRPMDHSYAGRREFDLNVDGFAHYGMLPDFLQDLRNVGLSEEDLQPLYSSAEAFVRAWERCTGA